MAKNKQNRHEVLIESIRDMTAEELLSVLSDAFTGCDGYQDYMPIRLYEDLEIALEEFIQALRSHAADQLLHKIADDDG